MTATTDPYRVLHLRPDAPDELIAAAGRVLAKLHHPDVGGDVRRMAAINAARDDLLDPRKRAELDRQLDLDDDDDDGPPASRVLMPWGKWRGAELASIPSDYLEWALANADGMVGGLRRDVQDVLRWRRQ